MNVLLRIDGDTTSLTWEEFDARLREGRIPPTAYIRFDAVTGHHFMPIRELELYQDAIHSDQLSFRRDLLGGGLPLLTAILVGVQIRIYLWSLLPDADHWLFTRMANWGPAVLEQGETYRLISYGLLHLSLTHLAFNLLFLAYTGWNLERAMGRMNLLVIYTCSVLCGGLLSMVMSLNRASLGASGGDFGLIAACVILGWKYGDMVPASARKYFGWSILPYLVFTLLSGFQAADVDNWGHLGGILGGTAMMTLLQPVSLRQHARQNQVVRRGFVLFTACVLGLLAVGGQHLIPLVDWDRPGITATRPAYWGEGWTFTGDRGAFSPNRLAILVVATSTHPEPVDLNEAEARFLDLVGVGRKQAQVLERHETTRDGWPAIELRIAFHLSSEPHIMRAMLVARGHYLHRIHLHVTRDAAERYDVLWRRVLAHTQVRDPESLTTARGRVQSHPRSWKTWYELASAQHKAGYPLEARRSYEQSMAFNARRSAPVQGWLTLLLDYDLPGADVAIRQGLELFPEHPGIHLAAARLTEHLGDAAGAERLLLQASRLRPDDLEVQQALERRGLEAPPP